MLKYGSDKPDLRNPLVIADVTEEFSREGVTFNAFKNVIKAGGVVRAIPAPGAANQPRSFFDKLNEWARTEGAAGLGYVILEEEGGALAGKGPIAKFVPAEVQAAIAEKAGCKAGDAVFFSAGEDAKAAGLAGKARARLGDELGLDDKEQYAFCWITDFPQYEWSEDERKIDFSHNPFSMPNIALEEFLSLAMGDKERILAITAFQYDVVCNGYEIASGAIRNHRPDVMKKAFAIAGYEERVLEERFGGMYRAFQYGAPPHGGMAAGIDRVVMLLVGAHNLREVTLFPMNQRAEDLLLGAPSEVTAKQLRELSIRLNLPDRA
jgi:aspartyl-tRNA synthetase